MTDAEFIKSWRDKLVRPNRLRIVFTEDMCESLDRLERITAMWDELKDFAKKAPPHEPAWHIAWGAVVEKMRDLETAGPARKGESK